MKISVVVPVRNSKATIERALESVWSQTYTDIQLIVMDGASDDGTLEILKKHRDRISVLHSAPDKSSTDAINKSIPYVDGRFLVILCADDEFATPTVIEDVVELIQKDPDVDLVTGAIRVIDPAGLVATFVSRPAPSELARRMSVHLGGTFFRSTLFHERGFDLRMKVADDYEFVAYLQQVKGARIRAVDTVFVDFALGGHSNKVANDFAVARDCLYIRRTYFDTWIAWRLFVRDMCVAVLRRAHFRPLTWMRKIRRFFSSHGEFLMRHDERRKVL